MPTSPGLLLAATNLLAAKGHDYRADLLPFLDAVLGFGTGAEQLDAIRIHLERAELARTEWIAQHGTAGRSLAVAVVERAVADLRERGADSDDALGRLVQTIAHEELGAGGCAAVPDDGS